MPWRPTTAALETARRTPELSGQLHQHLVALGHGFVNPTPKTANVHLILCFSFELCSLSKPFLQGMGLIRGVLERLLLLKPNFVRKKLLYSTSVNSFPPPNQNTITLFWTLLSTSEMHLHMFLINPCVFYYRLFSFLKYCIFIHLNVTSVCKFMFARVWINVSAVCLCVLVAEWKAIVQYMNVSCIAFSGDLRLFTS